MILKLETFIPKSEKSLVAASRSKVGVQLYLSKYPLPQGSFFGLQYQISEDLYGILPAYARGRIELLERSFSSPCDKCIRKVACLATPRFSEDNCSRFATECGVHLKGILPINHYLLASLLDDTPLMRRIFRRPIPELMGLSQLWKELVRHERDELERGCERCFLSQCCPTPYKLRRTIGRCTPVDKTWVKRRLPSAVYIPSEGDISELSIKFDEWSVLTHMIYKPHWLLRAKRGIVRIASDDFIKSRGWYGGCSPPHPNARLIPASPEIDSVMFSALRALARQAKALCVFGPGICGTLGPFVWGNSITRSLREVSYYWPQIYQSLHSRCDIWNMAQFDNPRC